MLNIHKFLISNDECKICMENAINAVFLECGHIVACLQFAQQCVHNPICRQQIEMSAHRLISFLMILTKSIREVNCNKCM